MKQLIKLTLDHKMNSDFDLQATSFDYLQIIRPNRVQPYLVSDDDIEKSYDFVKCQNEVKQLMNSNIKQEQPKLLENMDTCTQASKLMLQNQKFKVSSNVFDDEQFPEEHEPSIHSIEAEDTLTPIFFDVQEKGIKQKLRNNTPVTGKHRRELKSSQTMDQLTNKKLNISLSQQKTNFNLLKYQDPQYNQKGKQSPKQEIENIAPFSDMGGQKLCDTIKSFVSNSPINYKKSRSQILSANPNKKQVFMVKYDCGQYETEPRGLSPHKSTIVRRQQTQCQKISKQGKNKQIPGEMDKYQQEYMAQLLKVKH